MPGPIKRANKAKKNQWFEREGKKLIKSPQEEWDYETEEGFSGPPPTKEELGKLLMRQKLAAERRKALRKKRTAKTDEKDEEPF